MKLKTISFIGVLVTGFNAIYLLFFNHNILLTITNLILFFTLLYLNVKHSKLDI